MTQYPSNDATAPADVAPSLRSYEEICEDSRISVGNGDDAAWKIGDNAVEIWLRWGDPNKEPDEVETDASLADYAREIGIGKSTVHERKQMAEFWPLHVRTELKETCPNITRSHMRKTLPLHDLETAKWAVEKCSERGWTVDQFGYILHRYRRLKGDVQPKEKPVEPIADLVTTYANSASDVATAIAAHCDELEQRYRIVVYAIDEATGRER